MSSLTPSSQFPIKISDKNMYLKLIKQINKDFQLAGIIEEFSLKSNPTEFVNQLQNSVINLINENFSDYLNLLYRIDISENKIKSLDGSDILTLSKQVTFLIIKREWEKVLTRNKL